MTDMDPIMLIFTDSARQAFYEINNIGWCARPPHRPYPEDGPEYYARKGTFKRASNLNNAINLSLRISDEYQQNLGAAREEYGGTGQERLNPLYQQAVKSVLEKERYKHLAGGDLRIGEIILLVDSDCRIVSSLHRYPSINTACTRVLR